MEEIEAKQWNVGKETFHHYAMAKLKLLHPLHLPDKECVQYLVAGIINFAVLHSSII